MARDLSCTLCKDSGNVPARDKSIPCPVCKPLRGGYFFQMWQVMACLKEINPEISGKECNLLAQQFLEYRGILGPKVDRQFALRIT